MATIQTKTFNSDVPLKKNPNPLLVTNHYNTNIAIIQFIYYVQKRAMNINFFLFNHRTYPEVQVACY